MGKKGLKKVTKECVGLEEQRKKESGARGKAGR